jgi:hypothetical protein
LAITFLDADFISSVAKMGIITCPGVAALIGDPLPAGVVPRDSSMVAAASTNGTSSVTSELYSKAVEERSDDLVFAVNHPRDMRLEWERGLGKR